MKTIRYQKMVRMEPREGVNFATVYIKQNMEQRTELLNHIRMCVTEITELVEQDDYWLQFIQIPMRGFKRLHGANRSTLDILNDMINEGTGKTKRGEPKDFALAPIERWNKLFKDTDYEIDLIQTFGAGSTNFHGIFDVSP